MSSICTRGHSDSHDCRRLEKMLDKSSVTMLALPRSWGGRSRVSTLSGATPEGFPVRVFSFFVEEEEATRGSWGAVDGCALFWPGFAV